MRHFETDYDLICLAHDHLCTKNSIVTIQETHEKFLEYQIAMAMQDRGLQQKVRWETVHRDIANGTPDQRADIQRIAGKRTKTNF